MQVSIARRLFMTFGVMLAVMVVMGLSSLRTMATLNRNVENVATGTASGVTEAGRIRYMVAGLEAALGQTVISTARADAKGTTSAIERVNAIQAELTTTARRLGEAAADNATKKSCAEMVAAIAEWKVSIDTVKGFATGGQAFEAAEAVDKSRAFADRTAALAASIAEAQASVLGATRAGAARSYRWSWVFMSVILLVALAVTGWGWWAVRGIRVTLSDVAGTLSQATRQVLDTTAQVATSAGSLSSGATEQAASLEETSASMEEMAAMTKKNAENAINAADLTAESERMVREANGELRELVAAMHGIQDASSKVAKIIKTIDEIAFQTNILALNAAVEAARAGEAGMGFAVVAGEVRNLAQRAAEAARSTALLIEDSSQRAGDGSAKVSRVEASITSITDQTARVKVLVDEISVASREQTQGIDQVTHAVAQMEKVTQTTAATAEESAAASQELQAQAEQSMAAVGRLEALVGGGVAAAPTGGARRTPLRQVQSQGKVTRMARPPVHRATQAERELPLDGTGTFGSF